MATGGCSRLQMASGCCRRLLMAAWWQVLDGMGIVEYIDVWTANVYRASGGAFGPFDDWFYAYRGRSERPCLITECVPLPRWHVAAMPDRSGCQHSHHRRRSERAPCRAHAGMVAPTRSALLLILRCSLLSRPPSGMASTRSTLASSTPPSARASGSAPTAAPCGRTSRLKRSCCSASSSISSATPSRASSTATHTSPREGSSSRGPTRRVLLSAAECCRVLPIASDCF